MLAKGGRAQGVGRDQVRACYLRVRLCVPSPAFRASLIFECVLLTQAGPWACDHPLCAAGLGRGVELRGQLS